MVENDDRGLGVISKDESMSEWTSIEVDGLRLPFGV